MINQISSNNHYDDNDEHAAKKVAHHIKMFWARSMKLSIIQYASDDGSELSDISKLALTHMDNSLKQ
jgi:formate dehydrogenase subunit delta